MRYPRPLDLRRFWRNPPTLPKPSFRRSTRTFGATVSATSSCDNAAWLIGALMLFSCRRRGMIWYPATSAERSERRACRAARSDLQGHRRRKTARKYQAARRFVQTRAARRCRARRRPFTQAALAIQQNNRSWRSRPTRDQRRQLATRAYRNAAVCPPDGARVRPVDPDQVIARLQPLAKTEIPWFGSAGEMTALALIKQGKTKEAGQLFARIAKDQNASPSVRNRSIQISGSLGVDSSAALGPQSQ